MNSALLLIEFQNDYFSNGRIPLEKSPEAWDEKDLLRGRFVVVRTLQGEIGGVAEGIEDDGKLIIRDEYGRKLSFSHGEVSVRIQSK